MDHPRTPSKSGHKRVRSETTTPTSDTKSPSKRRRLDPANDGATKPATASPMLLSNEVADPLEAHPETYRGGSELPSPSKQPKPRGRPPKAAKAAAALQPQTQLHHPSQTQQPGSPHATASFPDMSPRKAAPASPSKSPSRSPAKSPLKSILTPSRKNRGPASERARKSVVFDVAPVSKAPVEVVFEDLPDPVPASTRRGTKSNTPKLTQAGKGRMSLSEKLRRASTKKQPEQVEEPQRESEVETEPEDETQEEADEEAQEEVEEELAEEASTEETYQDQVCEICRRSAPNQVLFCDVCDLGYHQKCLGISDIPQGDWLCPNCAQEDVTKTPSTKRYAHVSSEQLTSGVTPAQQNLKIPPIPNFELHMRSFQRVVVDRCTGRRRMRLVGQSDQMLKTQELIKQTVVAGEGNSMLIIGARGSGKTTMVESTIDDMITTYGDMFHTVRLNGFVHTDDKLALKEIWRQLGVEMEVDDDLMKRTSYADTLASILALLSHPTEIAGAEAEGFTSKSVVFIIDEFDMFAYHPRQTLLYNLFDIAQARKAPIAVIGCTTRLDVVDMLEKRVKSRFSHRYVYMTPARSLKGFWDMCRQGLVISDEDALHEGIDMEADGYFEFQDYWTDMVNKLYEQEDFQKLLKHHYYTSKSVPGFLATCVLPLSLLRPATLPLVIPAPVPATMSSSKYSLEEPNDCVATQSLSAPPSKAHVLSSLSDLDLSLLIAAARLEIVAHTDTVNFAMAYDEYVSLISRQRMQAGLLAIGGGARVWGRGVAGVAWEKLVNSGLLVPASIGGRGQMGGLEGKMWKVDMALEDIPAGAKLSGAMAKWCREI
ncbi:hypothetical protein TD95_002257 [Thielaviopsis punctulata]|uniref:PHD-type domain-containing protein n=1 Tax=Thielaviopsis punctulata TaxID=72032 RepID=A0A0F4ZJF2_9PEZI|nr:hypothetical protein TD95_002257 [Thielaviopsis punctulata]